MENWIKFFQIELNWFERKGPHTHTRTCIQKTNPKRRNGTQNQGGRMRTKWKLNCSSCNVEATTTLSCNNIQWTMYTMYCTYSNCSWLCFFFPSSFEATSSRLLLSLSQMPAQHSIYIYIVMVRAMCARSIEIIEIALLYKMCEQHMHTYAALRM